jgi:hypothetical protein
MRKKLGWTVGLAGATLLAFGARDAAAVTCLNDPNGQTDCNIALVVGNDTLLNNGFTGPYVTGNIHFNNANSVTVSFTSATQTIGSDTYQFRFGDLALNLAYLDDPGVSVSTSNVTFSGNFNAPNLSFVTNPPTNFNYPAVFGDFNAWLQQDNGYPRAVTSLQFDLAISGAVWSGADDVLLLNDDGHSAVAHIYVALCADAQCGAYADTQEGRGDIEVSGFATWPGDDDTTDMPEPAMIGLFGAGLIGLGLARRRRMRRA